MLENLGEYTAADRTAWENLVAMLNIRSGGLTFYGGLILATVACIVYGAATRKSRCASAWTSSRRA